MVIPETHPKISVIMNCFNGEKYLREAIESVRKQKLSDWEIIFWDNQSTDQSAEIVRSFDDPRIFYYLAPQKTTLSKARNLAVAQARGDWIAFLDVDDIWLPQKLEKQWQVICTWKQPEPLGLVYSRCRNLGGPRDGRDSVADFENSELPSGKILGKYLAFGNFIPLLSALVLKEAYHALGGIPEDYRQAEDYYLFAAVASRYAVFAVNDVCGYYRIHDNNLTKKQLALNFDEALRIIDTFADHVKKAEPQMYAQVLNARDEMQLRRDLARFKEYTDLKHVIHLLGWCSPRGLKVLWVILYRRFAFRRFCFIKKNTHQRYAPI